MFINKKMFPVCNYTTATIYSISERMTNLHVLRKTAHDIVATERICYNNMWSPPNPTYGDKKLK